MACAVKQLTCPTLRFGLRQTEFLPFAQMRDALNPDT